MFRFANSEYLYLLLIIPLMILIAAIVAHRRHKLLARFGNVELLRELMPDYSKGRPRLKLAIYLMAFACIVLAAARPQFGSKLREDKARGVEMMLVVDVSNSMLAEDFEPNRLERTKYAINKLFEGLQQERVGLVAFAGEPKVQLPITTDYRMARSFTKRLSPSLVSVQGTDLSDAIDLASLSFSQTKDASRVMILITDGEAHDADALTAAKRAAERGIRLFAIGIGSPQGAPIQIGGEFIKDEKGDMVVSRLNEKLLQEIAETGNGAYIRASNAEFGLSEIVDEINKMEKSERTTLAFEEYNEQFYWLLWAALGLLLIEGLLLDRRNPKLRKFNIFDK